MQNLPPGINTVTPVEGLLPGSLISHDRKLGGKDGDFIRKKNTSWIPSVCIDEDKPSFVCDWTRSHELASPSPRDASWRPVQEPRMQTVLKVCEKFLSTTPCPSFRRFLLVERLIQSCRIRGTYGISLQFLFPNEKCLCCNGVTFER